MKTTSSKTTRKKCQLMTNQIKNSYNIQTNNLITIKPIENIYEIKAKQKKKWCTLFDFMWLQFVESNSMNATNSVKQIRI